MSKKGVWPDEPCGALEQYAAAASRTVCTQDVIVLEVLGDARCLFGVVHSSVQLGGHQKILD
jgi:hypothetical protein